MSCMAHYREKEQQLVKHKRRFGNCSRPPFLWMRERFPLWHSLGASNQVYTWAASSEHHFFAPFIPVSSAPPHPPLIVDVLHPFFHRLPFFRPPPPAIPHSKSTSGLAPRHHSANRRGSGRKSQVNFEMNSEINFEVNFEMNFKVKKQ